MDNNRLSDVAITERLQELVDAYRVMSTINTHTIQILWRTLVDIWAEMCYKKTPGNDTIGQAVALLDTILISETHGFVVDKSMLHRAAMSNVVSVLDILNTAFVTV